MFRTVAYHIALIGFTLTLGGAAAVSGIIGIKSRPGGLYDWLARHWSRGILRAAGVPVDTRGMDRIPRGEPVVFVSNHQSWFDILALVSVLAGAVRFVAKKELAKIPVFGRALKSAGHIYIDRQQKQAAIQSYEEAAGFIRAGTSTVVFAEGTRSRTGNLLPFKKGPFVLAIAAQVPIVPVYCANTFDILPKAHLRIRPHPVTLYFGEAIPTVGMDYDDREVLMHQARRAIEGFRDEAARDRERTR